MAQASEALWPVLKEVFFAGKTVEKANFIKLEGPVRAESGAQVPITLTVEKPLHTADAIKRVYIIVDANPIPLAATYHFTALSGKAQIATRIRMETDSYVHAIGETADGRLYMTALPIRAAGGCGGPVDGDETAIRAAAGKIKLNVEQPVKFGEANLATLMIKHPMFTGLQRDLVSGGYRPAFYMQKLDLSYNGKPVMHVDFGVGTAEDPYMRFFYQPDAPGTLDVKAIDNEGKEFSQHIDVAS
ncbi:MAG TPA: quinoprotein dehydrogenase-associated SoxYZ-like carrier [Novimethylophilus sp.]|uniref:quinoprotein dehydrogenase-associated SoxYZ-like carrier n=1 Tax=Novimethylophilus sp. TaxID=2137426 RepID=UPI002F3EBC72